MRFPALPTLPTLVSKCGWKELRQHDYNKRQRDKHPHLKMALSICFWCFGMNGIISSLFEWLSRVAYSLIWLPKRPATPTVKKLVVLHLPVCVRLVAEVAPVRLAMVEDLWTVFDDIVGPLAVDPEADTSHTFFTCSSMFVMNIMRVRSYHGCWMCNAWHVEK